MNRRSNYEQEMTEIIKLREEGYTNIEIARATGLNHATISCSIRNIKDGMRYRDKLTNKVWRELQEKTR